MEKIFAVYKPKGPTSHDIINIIHRQTGEKKVGHAGTLDPLAEGVLVIGVGKESTKKLSEIVQKEKEYIAKIKLGQTSTTDDEEGQKTEVETKEKPQIQEIEKLLKKFLGQIKQVPPVFSAIKLKGQKAYKMARKGRPLDLPPRTVEIKNIELLNYNWPILEIKVLTGPGFYIRSLARDIGAELKTGGYLAGLIRTRVGQYGQDGAEKIEIKKS
jgi:tRNA pseudouridine55 synthase